MRAARVEDDGFTLVELLVVILLMGFLGAITTAGMAQAMKNTRQDSTRVNNSASLETQLQRLIKQVRVADPIRFGTSVTGVGTSPANSVVVDLYPATGCQRVEWRVNGTSLQQRTMTWTAASACLLFPATAAVSSDTGYVTRISNITTATPFNFLDSSGAVIAAPTAALTKQMSVTLTQTQPESRAPITMTASTELRNAV